MVMAALAIININKGGRGKNNDHLIVAEYDKSSLSILSTKEFLSSLQDIFSLIGVNSSLSKRHKNRVNNNFTLNVSGNLQIEKLLNWIYKNANIYLTRKHNKYIQLQDINANKSK